MYKQVAVGDHLNLVLICYFHNSKVGWRGELMEAMGHNMFGKWWKVHAAIWCVCWILSKGFGQSQDYGRGWCVPQLKDYFVSILCFWTAIPKAIFSILILFSFLKRLEDFRKRSAEARAEFPCSPAIMLRSTIITCILLKKQHLFEKIFQSLSSWILEAYLIAAWGTSSFLSWTIPKVSPRIMISSPLWMDSCPHPALRKGVVLVLYLLSRNSYDVLKNHWTNYI